MNWNKLINVSFAVLFCAVAAWAGVFFLQMHRELTALKATEASNRRRLAVAEARLKEQREYLDRLRHDPELVERVIREKLGYTRPEEFVFRFENNGKPAPR